MEKSLYGRRKGIIGCLLILVGIGILCNTNNDPTPFVERIFKPIEIESGKLYYGGFFVMMIIYYGLVNTVDLSYLKRKREELLEL